MPARQPIRDVRLAVASLAVGRLAVDRLNWLAVDTLDTSWRAGCRQAGWLAVDTLAVDSLDSLTARPSGREVI